MNLFEAVFANDPQSVAIIFNRQSVSYDELRDRTARTAKALIKFGITKGDRVALILNDSPEFVQLFIATCSLGAIAVPINTSLQARAQLAILNDCSARLLVLESSMCNALLTGAVDSLHFPETLLVVERPNFTPKTYETDFAAPNLLQDRVRIRDFDAALDDATNSALPKFEEPGSEQEAFILYTSGSTGEPKGAVHRQSDIFYTNQAFCHEVLNVRPTDRLFSSSRLPFAYGLGNSYTFPLLNGATSILCAEKPTPEIINEILITQKPTIFFAVPVIYNLLLEHHREHPVDCSSLRLCISAGEALPEQLGKDWEQAFGVPVLDGIGSTEMLHMFMSNHQGDVCYGSSGKPLHGYQVRLLDENDQPVANDAEGNLWVSGPNAAMHYWQRPAETARTFVDGWVRTGDLYRRDEQGYWFHMGRSDDCFKSSGSWVSPVEVEGILVKHPKVSRVAVVEDFDEHGLPCVCAFVVMQKVEFEPSVVENQFQALAAESLPRFKRPRRFIFVNDFPYTATGKVQRFKLREQLRHERGR